MSEEALNALRSLARLPVDEVFRDRDDDFEILGFSGHFITIGHVRDARAALKEFGK